MASGSLNTLGLKELKEAQQIFQKLKRSDSERSGILYNNKTQAGRKVDLQQKLIDHFSQSNAKSKNCVQVRNSDQSETNSETQSEQRA